MEQGMAYKTKVGVCGMDCFNCTIVAGSKIPCFMYNVMETLKDLKRENTELKNSMVKDLLADENNEVCIADTEDSINENIL